MTYKEGDLVTVTDGIIGVMFGAGPYEVVGSTNKGFTNTTNAYIILLATDTNNRVISLMFDETELIPFDLNKYLTECNFNNILNKLLK